jgi:signal transduction histidine kinase
MEQHKGGLRLESKVGEGTTVTLWLPVADEGVAPN